MRLILDTGLALLAGLVVVDAAAVADEVVVARLTEDNWDELVPEGKEVDAILGDYVLQNDHIRAVVAQPVSTRNANMTVRTVGGCLIDLTVRDAESDQLSAFYPSRRRRSWTDASIPVPGVDGRVEVVAAPADDRPDCVVVYSLNADDRFLTVTTTWTNSGTTPVTLTLADDLRADGGNEDMVKVPNGTHDLFWVHDIFWQQAYGIRAPGFRLRCNSNSRESVLEYEPVDSDAVTLAPGASFSLTRHVIPGRDLPAVMAVHEALQSDTESSPVTLRIQDAAGSDVAGARIAIDSAAGSRGTTVTGDDGRTTVPLPAGAYELTVTVAGHEAADGLPVSVSGDADITLQLDDLHRGRVSASITDGNGAAIPAKVEFIGSGDTPTPDWGPDSGEHFVRNLAYTASGRFDVPLRAGTYDVIVSHGAEYDAVFTKLSVAEDMTAELKAELPRVVDTPGWVSADFHSHSSPSGDNTGSQLGRVLNLAAENIEFGPCTEHNRVSTYDPHIASLGLQSYLASVSGMELTGQPLPLNHQNVFPLEYTPRVQDGGGPTTDGSPETQIERIALWDNRSRKLIQQNHPDIGWLFYDKDGDQQPDGGYARSFEHMDVMEVHPIDPILDLQPFQMRDGERIRNMPLFNWLQLLNQGFRIYGVVNTDAHYNYHGSGGLRIWIQSSTDDPGRIDPHEMMVASEEGRIIMSNGPYLEATLREASDDTRVVSGQDLAAPSGRLTAHVRVQCPNWMDVDTVFVLLNGRQSESLTFTRDAHPDLFGDGPVKFDRELSIAVDEDTHVIFVTGHRTEQLGPVLGPGWGSQLPAALSNPIFVDVDGDGFRPNGDTLDHPLPVKFPR